MPGSAIREFPVRVDGYCQRWQVGDDESLDVALVWRDDRGGAVFWLTSDEEQYPMLGIRVSGDVADVHYLPQEGHPGFRCVGGNGLLEGGFTSLVYRGCDPASGEQTPNEFVVAFETALAVAREFFHTKQMSAAVSWFEL